MGDTWHHMVCMLVVDLNIQDMMIPSWESQPSNPALVLGCLCLPWEFSETRFYKLVPPQL
jgi:hypothetical protein